MKSQKQNAQIKKLKSILEKSLTTIPKEKFALLLSGGLDSGILALLLKEKKCNFVCYTVEFYHPNFKQAEDTEYSKYLAKQLGLKLKIVKVNIKDVGKTLPKIIHLIKNKEVKMVAVALSHYFCLDQIKKDKIKTAVYDCICDCAFAGLYKHKKSSDINKTCKESITHTYKVSFPRDKAIADHHKINLIAPFLNKKLIKFSMTISPELKINKNSDKYILRQTALKLGLPKTIALRKKKAIQYSSNAQKIIKKLATKNKFKKMKDYLESISSKS